MHCSKAASFFDMTRSVFKSPKTWSVMSWAAHGNSLNQLSSSVIPTKVSGSSVGSGKTAFEVAARPWIVSLPTPLGPWWPSMDREEHAQIPSWCGSWSIDQTSSSEVGLWLLYAGASVQGEKCPGRNLCSADFILVPVRSSESRQQMGSTMYLQKKLLFILVSPSISKTASWEVFETVGCSPIQGLSEDLSGFRLSDTNKTRKQLLIGFSLEVEAWIRTLKPEPWNCKYNLFSYNHFKNLFKKREGLTTTFCRKGLVILQSL